MRWTWIGLGPDNLQQKSGQNWWKQGSVLPVNKRDIWATMSWHMMDLFIFLDFPHDSQEESPLFTFAHDSAIHMGVILYFSHDSLSHDSCQLLLTHSDSLVFHPFIYSLSYCSIDSYKNLIVLVTYCSCDVHCSLWRLLSLDDVYCPSDAIVHFTIKSGLLSSL